MVGVPHPSRLLLARGWVSPSVPHSVSTSGWQPPGCCAPVHSPVGGHVPASQHNRRRRGHTSGARAPESARKRAAPVVWPIALHADSLVPQVRPSVGLTWDQRSRHLESPGLVPSSPNLPLPRLSSKRRTRTWGTEIRRTESKAGPSTRTEVLARDDKRKCVAWELWLPSFRGMRFLLGPAPIRKIE